MLAADPAMLLTPLFGARLAAMVVFGLGALFDALAPLTDRLQQDNVYPAAPDEVAKVNLLWLLGMTLLIAGVTAAFRFQRRSTANATGKNSLRSLPMILGLGMFLAGLGMQVALALGIFKIAGIFQTLSLAIQLYGLFVLAQQAGTSIAARTWLAISLAGLFIIALLLANKTVFFYPALVAVLGTLSNGWTWRRAMVGGALLGIAFFVAAPIVTYARDRMRTGSDADITLGNQWQIVMDYAGGDRLRDDTAGLTLQRIDYVTTAASVMALYEAGKGSTRLAESGFILIPRLIWPDKPITSTSGHELNYALGFQDENQIGMTVFADLYWNVGWLALAIIPLMGFYFGAVSLLCRSILVRRESLMLPFAFASLQLGLVLDSDFTAAIMAPAIMNLAFYLALRLASKFLDRLPAAKFAPSAGAMTP
ncbi:MAG: hypothetical protein M3N06_08195 [Pseudomonadota bacterium]|nr:hypothetical protein [Pseudomonadota bacterium]